MHTTMKSLGTVPPKGQETALRPAWAWSILWGLTQLCLGSSGEGTLTAMNNFTYWLVLVLRSQQSSPAHQRENRNPPTQKLKPVQRFYA